jgi:hypothetical protein
MRILDGKNLDPGSGIRDGKYSDLGIGDPGWQKFGSGFRDKHPGSAKLMEGMLKTVLWIRDVYPGSIFSIPDPGMTRSRIPNETFMIMGFAVSLSARKSSSDVRYSPRNFRPNRSYIFFLNLILPV